MGQKVLKNSSIMSLTGCYVTREVYESGLLISSQQESADVPHRTLNASCTISSQCLLHGSYNQRLCDFQDYCNHLYYINDRCDCASAWKKTAGLVIPTST